MRSNVGSWDYPRMRCPMVNCKICAQEFESDRSLHAHLKFHQMRMVEYYQSQYPRYDLFTKNLILFKNKEQYFSDDFNSRENLKLWLNSRSREETADYLTNLFKARKEKKKWKYSPTQVELRTVLFPPVQFFHKVFGDYFIFCESLGLENRFNIFPNSPILSEPVCNKKDFSIFVDTREQIPLRFSYPIEIKTLNFGDYAFSDSSLSCDCYIERKSLNDFIGTLSGGLTRFRNEIERAIAHNSYLIVVVERSINDCRSFNSLKDVRRNIHKMKVTPEYVFRNVRDLLQAYKNLQFLFVENREESIRVIEKIFTSKCIHERVDLQLAYDLRLL